MLKHNLGSILTGHEERDEFSDMDYVRDGDIQGRSLVFLKAHCPCILPSLT